MDSFFGNGLPPNIVMIGGGGGNHGLLTELVQRGVSLTSITIAFDEGIGSEPPPREPAYPHRLDLRKSLLALYDGAPGAMLLHGALEFDPSSQGALCGYEPGNLILAAFNSPRRNSGRSVEDEAHPLTPTVRSIPGTLGRAELCAGIRDIRNSDVRPGNEWHIEQLPRIRRIFLAPQVNANPAAVKAIMEADAIVLGPGDLYTCVLPNLLPSGTVEAINESHATRVYVCNLMTKLGETHGFKASDFVREVTRYLGPEMLDWAIVNMSAPSPYVQVAYAEEGAYPVKSDLSSVVGYVGRVLVSNLANDDVPFRHDAKLTAEAILQITDAGRALSNLNMRYHPSREGQK